MAINDEELFHVLGLIYVLLRRETRRMIDIEWAVFSADYALEIIQLTRDTKNPELQALALRLETLHPRLQDINQPTSAALMGAKYVKTLR